MWLPVCKGQLFQFTAAMIDCDHSHAFHSVKQIGGSLHVSRVQTLFSYPQLATLCSACRGCPAHVVKSAHTATM